MRKFIFLLCLFTILLFPISQTAIHAQDNKPYLVHDINNQISDNSEVRYVLFSGPVNYFIGHGGPDTHGLWRTDGTPTGTVYLKDIDIADPYDDGSGHAAMFGGYLFFGASEFATGNPRRNELWRSNGTPDGTIRVADLTYGDATFEPDSFQVMGEKLYFLAGYRLWRLDTPDSQPIPIAGVEVPGAEVKIEPQNLIVLKNHLYFSASCAETGMELWVSDGTTIGTTYVVDLWPGDGSSWAMPLLATGDRLYFVANNGPSGFELWRYDQILGTIHLNSDINALYTNFIWSPALLGDEIIFTACQQDYYDCHLFITEGETTHLIFNQHPELEPETIIPQSTVQTGTGAKFLFFGLSSHDRYDLWATDGTEEGTEILYTSQIAMPFGPWMSERPDGFFYGGRFYFYVNHPLVGVELWQSNGTQDGTHLVKDIWPGTRGSYPQFIGECNGVLCFMAHDGDHGTELWTTDGTLERTQMVADLNTSPPSSNIENMVMYKGQVFFTADDWENGSAIWKTDGTSDGTQPVWSNPNNPDISPALLTAAGDHLFFVHNNFLHGTELWVTKGTAETTHMVADIVPGPGSSFPTDLVFNGKYLFFATQTGERGQTLWRSDGTNNGTIELKHISTDHRFGRIGNFTPYQGMIIFANYDMTKQVSELWKTDGTYSGTQWFANVSGKLYSMAEANGKIFFLASSDHSTPWQTDGTTAGTSPIPVPDCLDQFESLYDPVSIGGSVIWIHQKWINQHQYNVLKTSGDSLTCLRSIPIDDGNYPHFQGVFPILPDYRVAIFDWIDIDGWHTWVSDGTTEGSRLIPGDPNTISSYGLAGPYLFFPGRSQDTGYELWVWEGTDKPAYEIADIYPGPFSSRPDQFLAIHDLLFFEASDGYSPGVSHGRELWAYEFPLNSNWLPIIQH